MLFLLYINLKIECEIIAILKYIWKLMLCGIDLK